MEDHWHDYYKSSYYFRAHLKRYQRYVERNGFPCQECKGRGGATDIVCDGMGPWEPCGWCEGTGKVTRWIRGLWLRFKKQQKTRLVIE